MLHICLWWSFIIQICDRTTWRTERGMSLWHDMVDWVGGFPFEVAKPEEIFEYYKGRGFVLEKLRTSGGLGCNEYVFRKLR